MEFYDILNEDGSTTERIESNPDTHSQGLLHRVVHVWVVNSQKEILLQRRSLNKVINPNMWDFSAGGHVLSKESSIEAGIRKCSEELGIEISEDDLKYVCTTHVSLNITDPRKPGIHNHLIDTYVLRNDIDTSNIKLDPEESIEVKFMNNKIVEEQLGNKDKEFAQHPEEFEKLFNYISHL